IPLKTGLEELFSIWNLESRERNGFKIYDKKIYIPNILVKINGTYNNTETYWNKMLELLKVKDGFILLIDMFPISKPKEEKIDYKGLINKNGYINIEKMRKSSFYNLSFLKTSLQENILLKINEIIDKKILIYGNDYNFKIKIIKTIFSLDKKILNLLQIFDYPFYIPKIVIYDNTEKILSEEDCITIVILHSLGIDIALITPSGYNNIENYVNKNFIDFQNLEKLKFDLNYSKKVKKYLTNSKLIVKKTLSYHLKEYFKKYN
ncbi:MAG: YceG family protein, partial [Clostridiales bacterium]